MNPTSTQTHNGHRFDLANPENSTIDIKDIAQGLSMQCRYNGHVKEFYSVAEHSMLVAEQLPDDLKIYGLMHDAAEAYVGDMISPLKRQIPEFSRIEAKIMQKVCKKFDLDVRMFSEEIKRADLAVARIEAEKVLKHPPVDGWHLNLPYPKYLVDIAHLDQDIARSDFMYMFNKLMKERNREPKVIGYQILNKKTNELPDDLPSFLVLNEITTNVWLASNDKSTAWKVVEVYEGEIEEPIFM